MDVLPTRMAAQPSAPARAPSGVPFLHLLHLCSQEELQGPPEGAGAPTDSQQLLIWALCSI